MNKLIERQDTTFYSNIDIDIRVSLADMEQPIIEVDKSTGYNNATNNYNYEKRKFVVKEFLYSFEAYGSNNKNKVLTLKRINGSYFLKGNKKVGGRDESLYIGHIDKTQRKAITDQIPAHLHNYARTELEKQLKPTLDYMVRVGVVI